MFSQIIFMRTPCVPTNQANSVQIYLHHILDDKYFQTTVGLYVWHEVEDAFFHCFLFCLYICIHTYTISHKTYTLFFYLIFRLKLCFILFITSTPVLSFCIGIALVLYICLVKVISCLHADCYHNLTKGKHLSATNSIIKTWDLVTKKLGIE